MYTIILTGFVSSAFVCCFALRTLASAARVQSRMDETKATMNEHHHSLYMNTYPQRTHLQGMCTPSEYIFPKRMEKYRMLICMTSVFTRVLTLSRQ